MQSILIRAIHPSLSSSARPVPSPDRSPSRRWSEDRRRRPELCCYPHATTPKGHACMHLVVRDGDPDVRSSPWSSTTRPRSAMHAPLLTGPSVSEASLDLPHRDRQQPRPPRSLFRDVTITRSTPPTTAAPARSPPLSITWT
jgi:hypothetical protein